MPQPIWTPAPSDIEDSLLSAFGAYLGEQTGQTFSDYQALHHYSVTQSTDFWRYFSEFAGVKAQWGQRGLDQADDMFEACFFDDTLINYAENMLLNRSDNEALVFWGEDKVKSRMSFADLYKKVAQLQAVFREAGVRKGDRVAGFVPNMPEAIIAMLAAASLGAVWSSCSPDFGEQGVLDRFGQIEPTIFIGVDGYFYNGKTHDRRELVGKCVAQLPSVRKVLMIRYIDSSPDLTMIRDAVWLDDAIAPQKGDMINFEPVPFNHPLVIMFSSGTTGVPKCIMHGHGGTLLQHRKEHMLHNDIRPGDRMFYFTTCSWMMWNWLVTGLASGASLMLYDGSPFYPDGNVLFDFARDEKFTFFGTSAKYIDAVAKAGLKPGATHELTELRSMTSTGSPLLHESYDFVYQHIKQDIHLASISGGTDIVSCFVLGCPNLPVYRGEIQCAGLGMDVQVWNDDGKPVQGVQGELVCASPFPSQPVGFWNDPDREKYKKAYFSQYDGIWAHGDFAEITANNGLIIYGRSDATLNPGGVRIGTAEIYRQVDQLDELMESLVIGQQWEDDVRVVLFVKLREGVRLDEALITKIKQQIRSNCTPRHVPAKILEVSDLPRTKSGKIVEIPVRDVVHGREVKNKEALANPEALAQFANRPELAQ